MIFFTLEMSFIDYLFSISSSFFIFFSISFFCFSFFLFLPTALAFGPQNLVGFGINLGISLFIFALLLISKFA
jgi:hypothetical protein